MATGNRFRTIGGKVLAACAASILILGGCGKNDIAKSSQVLAKVGGKEITIGYFERQLRDLPESTRRLVRGTGEAALLNGIINRELLYQEAKKRKLDRDPEVRRKIEDMDENVLVNVLIENEAAKETNIGEDEARLYYNSHPAQFRDVAEVRISRIVVASGKDAQQLQEKLKAKEGFEALAAEYSIDAATAARGGDSGYLTYAQLPPEIRAEVSGMEPGQTSRSFKTAAGYEIYKVTGRRVVDFQFDGIKAALESQLAERKFQKTLEALIGRLKKSSKIEINEALLNFKGDPAGGR